MTGERFACIVPRSFHDLFVLTSFESSAEKLFVIKYASGKIYFFFAVNSMVEIIFHSGLLKRSSFKIFYGQDLPCKLSENLWNFVFIKDL